MFKTVRDVKKGEEYMVGYSSVEENLNTYGIRCKWRPLQDLVICTCANDCTTLVSMPHLRESGYNV